MNAPNNSPAPAATAPAPFRPLLTEHDAAALLNVSARTLQMWRLRGEGPPFVKVGALVRYSADHLAAWVESRARTNTSQTGPAAA